MKLRKRNNCIVITDLKDPINPIPKIMKDKLEFILDTVHNREPIFNLMAHELGAINALGKYLQKLKDDNKVNINFIYDFQHFYKQFVDWNESKRGEEPEVIFRAKDEYSMIIVQEMHRIAEENDSSNEKSLLRTLQSFLKWRDEYSHLIKIPD